MKAKVSKIIGGETKEVIKEAVDKKFHNVKLKINGKNYRKSGITRKLS